MAVDVSKIPNNNKFDPVREAILQLQEDIQAEGQIAYDGTLTINTSGALTGSGTFTANQSTNNTITIGLDDSSYLTEEVNDLTAAVTWANVPDANITQSSVTQHQAALSITESQISDLGSYIELTDLSVTTQTASGGGALSYDDTTGVFTFTPADAGTGLTLQQVTANGNTTNYGISTGNITVQPSGTGSGVVTIQANSVGDARLDLTAGTGGTGVIKTTNDVAITFEPNATEKVVIASDGNMNVYEKLAVGKTTAASTYSLEVDGTAMARTFKAQMEASGTTYTGTVDQYFGSLQIRTDSGGTISLGGSGPTSVQNNVFIKDGDLDVNGDVTADNFIGDGSQLTNLPSTGTSSTLQDVTDNGASTTNDISTGRITLANNVSTGGFTSFDDYQILLYEGGSVSESYGIGIESYTMMFNSDTNYRFYVGNSLKVTINSSGNVSATSFTGDGSGLTSVDADTLDGFQLSGTSSVSDKIFNNKGNIHSTFTDFNTVMNAGANYLQEGNNGPTGTLNDQWYGFMLGLGSDYGTATGNQGDYASQLYWNRQSQGGNPYLWARDMESGTWGSWRKMSAGNADNADTLNGVAGSGFLRSDQDDTATGRITINNNSNSVNDPTLTITSSQGGGSFGRLMFSGTSTVAGVINRSVASSDLYFDEDSDTGNYYFRSSGRAHYYGKLTVGSTNDTDGKLVVRGDANSGMVSFFKNLDTGTTSYAEVIVRSVDSDNDLRLGSSKSYADSQWVGGWVFAPRTLLLKSNNDVNIFAGGTDNSNIVATFAGSAISLNQSTEVTGKVTITGSPAIELTGSGTGTYNKTVIYNDQTYGFLVEGTKATDSNSAAKKPITLTWRGGYNSNGGLNLTGTTKLYTDDTGLGIGTTSPASKLHVAGSAFLSDDVYVGDSSNNLLFTTYSTVGGAYSGSFGWNSLQLGNNGGNFIMAGNNAAGGQLGIYTNVTSRYRYGVEDIVGTLAAWFDASGNMGIGNSSPSYKLDVSGGSGFRDTLRIISGSTETVQLSWTGSNTGVINALSGGSIGVQILGSGNTYFNGGNVGIGTTSPSVKLDVNGIIKANGNQVNPQEYGVSMVGNFGQWQAHGTYADFNTVPAYWGWNYIQGNGNAPNSSSSQWYRGRFSLGNQYGLGTSSNDYWMEIAVPRYNYVGGDAGQMFVRACEDGVEGSWYQVGRKIIGDFTATGDVVAYGSSDKRLKDNITPIPNAIEKVQSIGGYEFDWNDNQETYKGHDVGVIAQEVEDIMPEVVTTREDGYKAVKYEKLVPILIEAIKDQQKQIDELKARLDA